MGLFYADDGMVGSWDPKWLQGALNVVIRIFRQYRLLVNIT